MSRDPDKFWRLIDRVQLSVNRYLTPRLWRAGYTDFRPAHAKVFENLSPISNTVTSLAENAQMTKQAMSELVIDLETLGYLRRVPHPSDRRAKQIVLSCKGEDIVRVAFLSLKEMNNQVEKTIGSGRLAAAQETMEKTLDFLTSEESSNAPKTRWPCKTPPCFRPGRA